MKTYPRIFQLMNVDDEPAGLYVADVPTEEMSDEKVVKAIGNAYDKNRDSNDCIEDAEKELEKLNIYRIYATEVCTNVI